jgi:PAS domain S-box-containing protein
MKLRKIPFSLRVILLYMFFGGLWILLSDQLLEALIPDIALLTRLQTYKGWVFVISSALLIYVLLKNEISPRLHAEERTKNIFDNATEGIFQSTPDGRYLVVNPAMARIYGFQSAEEMIASITDISTQIYVDQEEREKFIKKMVGYNVVEEFEARNYRKDGSIIWTSTNARTVRNSDNEILYFEGFSQDITSRKKADRALRTSEERFSTVFHASPIATCITTLEEGTFVDANEAYLKLSGLNRENIIGQSVLKLNIYPDGQKYLAILQTLKREQVVRGINMPFQTASGEQRDTLVFFDQIELGGEACILSMFYDITEAKHTTEALRNSEASYQGLFNSVTEAIYIQDRDGKFLDVNDGALQMYGYPRDYFIGQTPSILSAPDKNDPERISKAVSEAFKGNPQQFEFWGVRANGEIFPKDVRLYKGNYLGQDVVIAVAQDITERKKNETEIQRRLDELVILHEVALAGTQATNIDELIEHITDIVVKNLYPDNFGIFVYDQEMDLLTPHPSYHGNLTDDLPLSLKRSQGITGYVATTGRSYRVTDVRNEPLYIQADTGTLSELSIPVTIGDRLFGVLNAESQQANFFSEADEQLLTTIAGTLAVSIQKLELLNLEKSRRREAETLNEAAAIVSTSLELEEVLDAILISVKRVVPFDSASIFLLEGELTKIVAGIGYPNIEKDLNKPLRRDSKLFDQIKQTGEAILIPDVREDSRFTEWNDDGESVIRSWMGVPLIARGMVIGFLTIDSHQPNTYNPNLAFITQTFAYQAAAAITNAQSFEAEQLRRQEADTLRNAATAISSSLDLDQVLETILTSIREVISYDSASVFLVEGKKLLLVATRDIPDDANIIGKVLRTNNELFREIRRTGQALILEDAQTDQRFESWDNINYIHGWMGVPLITRNIVIGYISLDSRKTGAYNSHDASMAQAFAHQAAATIENARFYSETTRRLFEMESINRISIALRIAQTLEDMLPGLLEETLKLFNLDAGAIWLHEPGTGLLNQVVAKGWLGQIKQTSIMPDQGIVGRTFSNAKVYRSSNFDRDAVLKMTQNGFSSAEWGGVCVPIQATNETIGVLVVSTIDPSTIRKRDINLLNTISEIAGNALHRASLHERTERQVRRLTALRDVDTAIASSFDLRVTLSLLVDQIIAQLEVDAANVMLFDPNTQILSYAAGRGFRSSEISKMNVQIGNGLCGKVILERKIIESNNILADPRCTRKRAFADEDFKVYYGVPLLAKGQIKGVLEIFHRTPLSPSPGWFEFMQTLAGQAAIAIDSAQLFNNLQRSNQELALAYDTTLEGWGKALELRDKETEGHTQRVADLTLRLAKVLGLKGDELMHIRRGVLLHDIGKMGIPDEILLKPGSLSEAEWEIMRLHPKYAHDLLFPISFLRPALDIPFYHHERWDGSGYPHGLKGEEIPLAARIFAVVDVWDALLSDRPYRVAQTVETTYQYLKENSGKLFDPEVVSKFLRIVEEDEIYNP